jgi:alpha-beta hydrolase superfamily lysophospholipase
MKNGKGKKRLRSFLVWALWVLLVQFVLINISAALYAHKLTHLKPPSAEVLANKPASRNIFSKTWRLFTGPTFYRQPVTDTPTFGFTALQLKTKGGIIIDTWYGRADSSARGTVLLFHGLTSNKGQVLDEATAFRTWGYNVLVVDTRSHGNSQGDITTFGFKEAEEVKLAYDQVIKNGEKNIVLWGTSMGAVIIMKAISDYQIQPSGIIIDMPFLSLQAHLKGRARLLGFPSQPFGFLTTFWIGVENGFNGFGFKTTRYAKHIHCPVLEQYGEDDEAVLKPEVEAIYESIPSANKKLVIYENAVHESFLRNDPVTWKKEVKNFLDRLK